MERRNFFKALGALGGLTLVRPERVAKAHIDTDSPDRLQGGHEPGPPADPYDIPAVLEPGQYVDLDPAGWGMPASSTTSYSWQQKWEAHVPMPLGNFNIRWALELAYRPADEADNVDGFACAGVFFDGVQVSHYAQMADYEPIEGAHMYRGFHASYPLVGQGRPHGFHLQVLWRVDGLEQDGRGTAYIRRVKAELLGV